MGRAIWLALCAGYNRTEPHRFRQSCGAVRGLPLDSRARRGIFDLRRRHYAASVSEAISGIPAIIGRGYIRSSTSHRSEAVYARRCGRASGSRKDRWNRKSNTKAHRRDSYCDRSTADKLSRLPCSACASASFIRTDRGCDYADIVLRDRPSFGCAGPGYGSFAAMAAGSVNRDLQQLFEAASWSSSTI